jgi:hypothetical protein
MTLIALLAGLPGAVLGTLWSPVVSLPLTRGFFPPHPRPLSPGGGEGGGGR